MQNGKLSAAGMALACETVGKYKKLCRSLNVSRLQVFATASLRNVSNTREVAELIEEETGLRPDVLSARTRRFLAIWAPRAP